MNCRGGSRGGGAGGRAQQGITLVWRQAEGDSPGVGTQAQCHQGCIFTQNSVAAPGAAAPHPLTSPPGTASAVADSGIRKR